MNSKVFFRRVVRANLLAFLCWMVFAAGAMAQLPGGGNAGMNASLLQLFGDIPGFTAQAEVQLREKGAKTPTSMPMGFSALSGNVRLDIDMGRIKSDQVTPDMLAGFKTLGLDRLATVIRKDRKAALLVYPSLKSFVEMPFSKEEASDFERRRTIKKTKLGRETVAGQACEKTRVIVEDGVGPKQELTVWYATDLSNFPMRIEMNQPELSMTMQFSEVKLQRPEGRQFDAPAGFQRFASAELLVQNATMNALGGKSK